jgi:hypothetical protein
MSGRGAVSAFQEIYMANVTFAQVMTQLVVTKKQLLWLMQNPSFPAENAGAASSDQATFVDTQINSFQTQMQSAKANGFALNESMLKNANFTNLAAAAAGKFSQRNYSDPVDVMLAELPPVVGP